MKDWNDPEGGKKSVDTVHKPSELDRAYVPINTNYNLEELELITTIGVGAFGRVELVRPVKDETRSFALKRMSKGMIKKIRSM